MQMADFVRPRFSDELKELGNARVAQAVLFARRVNTGQDAASYAGVLRWKSRTGAGDQGEEAAPDADSEASCALGGGLRGRGRGLQGPGDAGEEATPTRLLFFVSARTNKRHHHHHHAA